MKQSNRINRVGFTLTVSSLTALFITIIFANDLMSVVVVGLVTAAISTLILLMLPIEDEPSKQDNLSKEKGKT